MKRAYSGVVFVAMASVSLAVMPACAASAPQIVVTDAWFRALPESLPAGGYFTLQNEGNRPLTLVGATSQACAMLMLHKSETMSGMSGMSEVTSVDVPAGGTLAFAPGGYHLMCMSPGAAMKSGGTVSVALKFSDGTKIETEFAVRSARGK